MTSDEEHARLFVELRPLLFTIAYEILGTATESDDVLQESYLRWADADLSGIQDTKAYLAKVVTRQALNAVRSRSRRREDYVGPWLPEPILLDEHDPSRDVVLAESVSTAMLVVLESLSADERAVFVLREVFGFSHDEIASMLDRSSDAVRQMAHRARKHVEARRPRYQPADAAVVGDVTAAFLMAASTGEVGPLMEVLAPDVVWTADSDGKATAARRPIHGADAVARLLVGMSRVGAQHDLDTDLVAVNGLPGLVVHLDGELAGVFWFHVVDGRIEEIYAMRNPDKLAGLAHRREIAR
ncbi:MULTISPECIES: RNA polymerase sigma factor SigJ [unclassified Gordonia (in: high G+C Gram-positive bacteria)]|uniref:RNA polymerase sigma factor SigJ n=1 Tax=unclassified Gordonia (in: high G+C Gram-positive bacteria) TaxID=2657482 RepID=UPI001F0CEB0B|nr:RNA polymerase sigma factor SigJ [Gordonia sp. ABSL49_1]MCH5641569.1 RNA polymerase sigma factor SigJ [Gordonia sp. ABSL49_1]